MIKLKYFLALFFLCGLYSCSNIENKQKVSPDVYFTEVGVRTVPVFQTFVGQTYGLSDIAIQSRVEGWITGIYFKEGSFVKKGDLLYTIDDLPTQTKIDAAKASLAEANINLVRAKSDYDRVKPLADMNALSKRDLDNAVASYDAAKSEVEIAKAVLKNNQIEHGYTRIVSPITGLIGMSKVQIGDYVSRGIGASQALNTVSEIDQIRVRFSITENDYLTFRRAIIANGGKLSSDNELPMTLILTDGTIYPEQGRFDIIDREINATTGALLIQAIFENKERILRPGQFVKVRIQTEILDNAIIVPQSTVNQMQNIYQVFVLNPKNKLEARIVEVGDRIGKNWVIKSGLKQGEKIVNVGNIAVIKGDAVVRPIDMKWNYDDALNTEK